jgi:sulfatase maturation enzyme AslB (radical SAM superfamily)
MSDNFNILSNEFNPFQKFKVLCWYDRLKKIKTGKFAAPVNIALDLIQGTAKKKMCGEFNCNFCMSNFEEVGEIAKIPRDVLMNIPQFFNEWGVRSICLAGHHSDPAMYNHSDLMKFLRLCNRWNVEVGFVTNGAYLTKKLMEEIARTCNWSGFSVNAGTEEDHALVTNTKKGTFKTIIDNMKYISGYAKEYELDHDVGYKMLITDDNYKYIYDGVINAKAAGARHMQIRPAELSVERSEKIDTKLVDEQIRHGLELEVPGEFEIFGIKEKFTPDFKKITPRRCIASPLGSTWMANGDIVICPDRRWSAHLPDMTLGNYVKEGLEEIRRKWGGKEHLAMITAANADIKNCIRCTSLQWQNMYEHTIEKDDMDLTLI